MTGPRTFRKGSLWTSILAATERARRSGALLPIPTEFASVEDAGVRFQMRVLAGLAKKDEERKAQTAASAAGRTGNPFLPPERDLVVADITDTHLALLNKFNVVEHHLLVITRSFENQDLLLTPADLEALWLCMAEYDALGFYNGGAEAGASQQHKHLQLVPLPLAPEGPAVPIAPLLERAPESGIGTVPDFPFLHAFCRLDRDLVRMPREAALAAYDAYRALLRAVGMNEPGPEDRTMQSSPYCLLMTRDWMLLVPRTREHFEDISLNSLAFAGSLFVRNTRQLERVREVGPMRLLRSVTREAP